MNNHIYSFYHNYSYETGNWILGRKPHDLSGELTFLVYYRLLQGSGLEESVIARLSFYITHDIVFMALYFWGFLFDDNRIRSTLYLRCNVWCSGILNEPNGQLRQAGLKLPTHHVLVISSGKTDRICNMVFHQSVNILGN